MPQCNKVTLIEIDGEQFTRNYLAGMLPAIKSLARSFSEHGDNIENAEVLHLQDPDTGSTYSVWWSDLEQLVAELPALLAN